MHVHLRAGSNGRADADAESDTDTHGCAYTYTVAHAVADSRCRGRSVWRGLHKYSLGILRGFVRRPDMGQGWNV